MSSRGLNGVDVESIKPCLSLTAHDVAPEPHPTFLGGKAWTCPRCERVFSEPHPTYIGGVGLPCDERPEGHA